MIDYIVNNSISHPPHPRRAVPANLPPGAFFIQMDALIKWVALSCLCLTIALPGIAKLDPGLSSKIAELRLKSNAHGKFVEDLLAREVKLGLIDPSEFPQKFDNQLLQTEEDFNLPEVILPDPPTSDVQYGEANWSEDPGDDIFNQDNQADVISDLPEVILPNPPASELEPEETNWPEDEGDGQFFDERDQGSEDLFSEDNPVAQTNSSDQQNQTTYEELYASKVPQRRVGYYFGPFIGPVFPDDSAVKDNTGSKTSYKSNGGVVGGFRIGNDFGSARIEGEYAFLTYSTDSDVGSGRNAFHNLNSRLIMEKSLGGRADIRVGIGLGVGFINKELGGKEYDGVGFSYDFLLGWSFRVSDNWSVNLDYRHYLTSAHESYDRAQGHIVEFGAGFDL